MTREFGIAHAEEAAAYAGHPVLGPRLVDCVRAILLHKAKGPQAVLGAVDAMKLRSCLRLFERVAPQQPVFALAPGAGCARSVQTPVPLTLPEWACQSTRRHQRRAGPEARRPQ